MSLGEIIKEKRKQLGLTQLDLAEKLNISILKVATFEADEEEPTDEEYLLLSKALECDVAELTDKTLVKEEAKAIEEPKTKELESKEEIKLDTIVPDKKVGITLTNVEEPEECNVLGVCHKCDCKITKEENLIRIPFNNYLNNESGNLISLNGERVCILCSSCKKTEEEALAKELEKQRKEKVIKPRENALIGQVVIFIVFAFVAMICFLQQATIAGIIIISLGFMISMFVACICFDNIDTLHMWKKSVKEVSEDESLKHETEALSFYVSFTLLLLFPFTPIIYVVALIKNLLNGNYDYFISHDGKMYKDYHYSKITYDHKVAKQKK